MSRADYEIAPERLRDRLAEPYSPALARRTTARRGRDLRNPWRLTTTSTHGRAPGSPRRARPREGNGRLLSPRRPFAVGHGVPSKPGFPKCVEPFGRHRPVVGSGRPFRPAILDWSTHVPSTEAEAAARRARAKPLVVVEPRGHPSVPRPRPRRSSRRRTTTRSRSSSRSPTSASSGSPATRSCARAWTARTASCAITSRSTTPGR